MIELQEKPLDRTTNDRALIVQRRFPTYDFVAPTLLSVAEASKRLDDLLSNQERPRGFLLSDPRVAGSISGSTFTLRRRESSLGGSVAAFAEGYLVPADMGSNVYIRVQLPASWWAFDVLMPIIVFVNLGWTLKGVAVATGMVVVLLGVRAASIAFEASQIAGVLRRVLAPGPGA